MEFTFDTLPKAVTQLYDKLENIERLLLVNSNQTPPETERWLNLSELCEYLPDRPVKATVYGWVNQRVIPFHKHGKALIFLKSDIDNWLKAGRKKTVAETANEAETYLLNNKKRGLK
jgi:hypothetical protein